MEKKATLILVDFQKDFISGTLAVKGAESALEHTLKLLESGKVGRVIFTLDWHPFNHCSFKENGGQWPIHCVQHTEGALIYPQLLNACTQNNIFYEFAYKGMISDKEEYGAFSNIGVGRYEVDLDDNITIDRNTPLIICGIAGDYCVLETIKNLEAIWNNLQIFIPGIASIDNGVKLHDFINENSLKVCL